MSNDWMPRSREQQLEMAKNWMSLIRNNGETEWKMEYKVIENFYIAVTSAEAEFYRPQKEKNVGTNVVLREAFRNMNAVMRDIKRRYFLTPPVSTADIANLGLKVRDNTPTNVPAPSGQATAEISYPGSGQLLLHINHINDTQTDQRANYGVKIYYGIMGEPSEKDRFRIQQPPKTGDDLPHSVFTRQKKYKFDLSGESGKQIFFCIRYENSKGQPGPWGNIISSFIP